MDCINHPDIESNYICLKCKQPLCERCVTEIRGEIYCPDCVEFEEEKESLPRPFQKFFNKYKHIFFYPLDFYKHIDYMEGFKEPSIFVTINFSICAIFATIYHLKIYEIITIPILGMASIFILTSTLWFVTRLHGGLAEYEEIFQVCAYATIVVIVNWIPIIGPLARLYGLFLVTVGIKEINGFSFTKSIRVVIFSTIIIVTFLAFISGIVGIISGTDRGRNLFHIFL